MTDLPRRKSAQMIFALAAALLFALSLLPGQVTAQNKPLQVGGLPVT